MAHAPRRFVLRRWGIGALTGAIAFAPSPDAAQSGLNQTSPFIGIWCLQDDPSRRALITGGPFGLTLRLEHGSSSTGVIAGPFSHQVIAPQWNLLHGTLAADEESITWSDTTYWTRCRPRVNIEGIWYAQSDPARPNRIDQTNGSLGVVDQSGLRAKGAFTGRTQIAVQWPGLLIYGMISAGADRIDWANGTYWTRAGSTAAGAGDAHQ